MLMHCNVIGASSLCTSKFIIKKHIKILPSQLKRLYVLKYDCTLASKALIPPALIPFRIALACIHIFSGVIPAYPRCFHRKLRSTNVAATQSAQ